MAKKIFTDESLNVFVDEIKSYIESSANAALDEAKGYADSAVSGKVDSTTTVNNKPLNTNITLSASDVGALPDTTPIPSSLSDLSSDSTHRTVTDAEKETWNAKSDFSGDYNDLTNQPTASDIGAVPTTRTINGKALSSNITLSASDVGAIANETDPTVPSWAKASTKPSYTKSEVGLSNVDNIKQYSASNPPPYPVTSVNSKTGAVTLSAADVGADASGSASNALTDAKTYTDDNTKIPSAIEVQLGTNGSIGGYATGNTIPANTSVIEILTNILRKSVPPTYTQPTITLSSQGTSFGSHEYGTDITAQVKATFTQNDAGALSLIEIFKNGTSKIKYGSGNPLTSDQETIRLTSEVYYTASATYAAGAVKTDNLGNNSPDGQIAAGTITSSTYKFTPYRSGYFYGVLDTDSSTPLTSSIIRGGTRKEGAYASGNLPLISASSVNDRKRIFVACPATETGLTKVIMPSAMNADCTDNFEELNDTITVNGANESDGIPYKVWVYEPAKISDDQTFIVTLG